jgi:ABC-2 type transport system permease protein
MLRVEILKAIHRVRTWVLGGLLAATAVLPAIILKTSPTATGPGIFDLARHAGVVVAMAAITLIQPFILPLGTALLSGETIALEASNGTLRYLIVRPVGRVRLVLTKYASVMVLLAIAVGWVVLVGLAAGGIAFGFGPVPTLSGTTVSTGAAITRVLAAGGYVLAGMAGLAAIGVFASSLTDSAPGATVLTMAVAIVSQILDNISSLRAIHPFLISHQWLAFVDLFRFPVAWDAIRLGVVSFVLYTAVFLGGAAGLFARRDVVS